MCILIISFLSISGAGCVDVLKILGMAHVVPSMEKFLKSRDQKYQIPKLSARTNPDNKDHKDSSGSSTSGLNTKTSTDVSAHEKQSLTINKQPQDSHAMSSMSIPKPSSGGRASSVSPKYAVPHDNHPAHNKDLHFYKSTSSDGMLQQHQNKHVSFSNPTTPTSSTLSMSSHPTPIPYSHPSSGNSNSGSYAPIRNKSPIHSSVLPKFLPNNIQISNIRQMQSSIHPTNSSSSSNKTTENMSDSNTSAKQNKSYQKKSPKLQSQIIAIQSSSSESLQYITDDEVMDEGRK